MKNIMKRAWEIYRTLTGDHIAKLAMAMKKAWSEVKREVKITKAYCMARLNVIIANSAKGNYNMYAVSNDWENYGKSRTYFSIVEKGTRTKHYVKKDFGYFDNQAGEYVPGKMNLTENFTFSGASF